jgi:hypothetical protein
MSIGNLKTSGGKGTNWPWQYKMLLGLDKIAASVATNGKEYEAELVSITCAGPVPPAGTVIRLEVRVWDPVTGNFDNIKYYQPGSTTADPADYTLCTKTYLESGDATEATLAAILAMNTSIEADTAVIETNTTGILADTAVIETNTTGILADTAAIDTATAAILVKNTEIETTANAIEVLNTAILADTAAIETNTDELVNLANTPHILRQTAVAVPATNDIIMVAVKSISFYNASALDAQIVAGTSGNIVLKAGETLNFDAGGNGNSFPSMSFEYDPDPATNAGDLVIIYVY